MKLKRSRVEVFLLAGFKFLSLDSLGLDFLVPYIWIFEKIAWDGKLLLE